MALIQARTRWPVLLLSLAVGAGACVGSIGDGDDSNAPPVGTEEQGIQCDEGPVPGPNPLRRLTSIQWANTVRDLLGASIDVGDDFPETIVEHGYRTYADSNIVSASGAQGIFAAAEHVAAQAVVDLPGLLGCDPAGPAESTCVDSFLADFGTRAYRRPLTEAERATLRGLYDGARADAFTAAEAAGMVIEAVLQSPQLLYRADVANDESAAVGHVVRLDDWEYASRLSYLFWDTMPDAELFAAAQAGQLHEPEQIEAQARRLVNDARALPVISRFVEDWLEMYRLRGATKDAAVFPAWGPDMAASFDQEIEAFTSHVLGELDGSLATLLSAPLTVANGPLAEIYGVSGPSDAATWQPVSLDAERRAGILTSAAFLAAHANTATTSPVARGAFVRAQLLCQVLVPPPGLVLELPPPDPNVSTKERLEKHRTDPACSVCHALMDPIGFGFENYDAIGAWRDTEGNDIPIDASGEIAQGGDATGPFVGGVELAQRLANSEIVRECVALQTFRFASGREETKDDLCSVKSAEEALSSSDGDLRELFVALALTDAFQHRTVVDVTEEP